MYSNSTALLRCEKISKSFAGVRALESVDFEIHPGRVHGLVGENGAGKSTLVKIISGIYSYDKGSIYYQGERLQIKNVGEMLNKGIVTVYQDLDLVETMTTAENIYLNNEIKYNVGSFIKQKELKKRTANLLSSQGINISPDSLVRDLPNDIKKMIQILKAFNRNPSILLLDEPTSFLTKIEERQVLKLILRLAQNNLGIVFISHYLSEIFEVCDNITILKDGRLVGAVEKQNTNIEEIITMMLGHSISQATVERHIHPEGKKVFAAVNLNFGKTLKSISLTLHEGEILGITGLIGSGCNEVGKALFGCLGLKKGSGDFLLDDSAFALRSPADALKNGISYITNDRVHEGLLRRRPLYENICLQNLGKYRNRIGMLDEKKMINASKEYVKLLDIKTTGALANPESLSGGNQQKVLVAKGLEIRPRIFIMNEPTIGIDVGTKFEIRNLIKDMASRGVSIVLITTELEELEKLCDRVLVMFRGEIVKEFKKNEISQKEIIEASTLGRTNNGQN